MKGSVHSFMLDSCRKSRSHPTQQHSDRIIASFKNKRAVWNHLFESGLAVSKISYWTNFWSKTKPQKEIESMYFALIHHSEIVLRLKVTKLIFLLLFFCYLWLIIGSNFAISGVISFEFSSAILYIDMRINVARQKSSGLKVRRQL